jgi:nucleoside-diphosphate-sugar epimerase
MAVNGNSSVLVTGASGLIGRAVLLDLLAKSSYDIRAQVRNVPKARADVGHAVDFTKIQMKEGDFASMLERDLRSLTQGCKTIIHCAGLAHRPEAPYQEYEVNNVRATQLLAEAAAASSVETFVFLSSSAVYGPGPFERVDESAPLKARTPYAVSKATSEAWLQRFKGIPKIIILRPSLVFGEGDRGNLLNLIREVKNSRYRHVGAASTGKSVIYSRDLARAITLCLEKLPAGVHLLNAANPEPVSMKDLAEEIAKALNLGKKIQSVPASLARLGIKAVNALLPGRGPVTEEQLEKLTTTTTCSVTRLVQATGFSPTSSLGSALKAEIAWATEANLL